MPFAATGTFGRTGGPGVEPPQRERPHKLGQRPAGTDAGRVYWADAKDTPAGVKNIPVEAKDIPRRALLRLKPSRRWANRGDSVRYAMPHKLPQRPTGAFIGRDQKTFPLR